MSSSQVVRRVTAAVSGVALGWASLGVVTSARAADTPSPWRVVKVNDFGSYDSMSAVAASGARNAWTFTDRDEEPRVLAQRWDGQSWRTTAMPAGLTGVVRAASATSASNAWAVGDADNADLGSFALRWNGRKWVTAHTFPTGIVSDVTAVRPGGAWVFSDNRRDAGVGTWRFDGHRWTQFQLPYSLEKGSAVSRQDVWAIGNTAEDVFKLIAHYDGTKWTPVPAGDALPDDIFGGEGEPSQRVSLRDVVAVSAQEVYVVGYVDRDDGAGNSENLPVAARWDGARWQKVDVPGRWRPNVAASDGRGGLWVSGEGETTESGRNAPVLMHRSADGTWSTATVQDGDRTGYVDGLALIPGTASLWGVGELRPADQSSSDGTIFRQGPG